ncbi:uncharacterized protein LOC143102567 [Alosa pseudoharengus]|uniref:uncharacterized protein LOC143102567 n=1 Tax=Alosa pseudoharengus TaxID=34774 RepID=UPI003F8C991A
MDNSEGLNLASQVLLEKLEAEANSNQAQSDQMEANLLLKLEVEDLKIRLEDKENRLTQAQDTIRALRDEVNSLHERLDIEKRKYQNLREQLSQKSQFVRPDSEDKTAACVDRPTLFLSCVSEPNLTDPSGPPSFLAQSSTTEPSPTYPSCSGDVVERDWHTTTTTTTTQSDVDQCRPSKPNPTAPSDLGRNTGRSPQPFPLRMLSVSLEDCRHKLQPNGVFNVQSLGHDDEDEDEGGDEDYADYTTESERYQFGSEDGPFRISVEEKTEFKRRPLANHLKLHQRMHNKKLLLNSPCAPEGEVRDQAKPNEDGGFSCDQCSRSFSRFSDLKRHQRTHQRLKSSKIQGHKCETCDRIFLHPSTLRIHERVHTREKPYTCTVCGKGFTQLGNLKAHHRKHEKESSLGHAGMQTQDMSGTSLEDQSKYEDNGKVSHIDLLGLRRKTHTEQRPYAFSACGKAFFQASSLREHIRTHKKKKSVVDSALEHRAVTSVARPKPHKCADCSKAFSFKAQLQVHQRKHTGEKPYACDICEKAFSQLAGLQVHQLMRHDKTGKLRVFECDVCEKKLPSSSALLAHKQKHQPTNAREKPYSCTLCEKQFSLLDYLRNHERWHTMEKRHRCSHCEKTFMTPSKLRQHMPKHTGEKPYSCSQCSKAFKSSSGLKEHIKIHTGEMPYKCSICNKAFKSWSNRQAHERIHSRERPYLCHFCGKAFRDGSSLNRHQKTHTGDKPHACTHCGQRFLTLTNLNRHQLRHTGQRPHLCTVCGKTFSRPEILKTHHRVHTGERPYCCTICDERFAYIQSLQSHQKREHQKQEHSANGRHQRARCVKSSEALLGVENHRPGIQNGGALDGIVDGAASDDQNRLTDLNV